MNTTATRAQAPTLADATSLPPVLGLRAAAAWLGISPSTAYRLVEHGTFPVPVHRIGASLRVPTAKLLAYLGITPSTATPQAALDATANRGEVPAPGDAANPAPGGGETAPTTGTGAARPAAGAGVVGEPPRPRLHPVGRASVDGPRAV